jgi:hypothetical protein
MKPEAPAKVRSELQAMDAPFADLLRLRFRLQGFRLQKREVLYAI